MSEFSIGKPEAAGTIAGGIAGATAYFLYEDSTGPYSHLQKEIDSSQVVHEELGTVYLHTYDKPVTSQAIAARPFLDKAIIAQDKHIETLIARQNHYPKNYLSDEIVVALGPIILGFALTAVGHYAVRRFKHLPSKTSVQNPDRPNSNVRRLY